MAPTMSGVRRYDRPPTAERSRTMSASRRRDTGPELAVRSLLHAAGLRYRVDYPVHAGGLRIRPDIVFPAARIAVFIDGCFWHCCPEHGSSPATNTAYWLPKLAANVERDAAQSRLLREAGWRVLRFWEHEIAEDAACSIIATVRHRRANAADRRRPTG